MTYTNAWDESQPQGTAAANTLDDIIRQLKVDIRERMESIVTDWDADPVTLTGLTGRTVTLGPHAVMPFSSISDGTTILISTGYTPLPLSSGWRITKAEVMVDKYLSSQLDCYLVETFFNPNQFGAGSYGPIATTTTGQHIVTIYSNSAGFLVDTDSAWTIRVTPNGSSNWRFYGVRITYTAQQ